MKYLLSLMLFLLNLSVLQAQSEHSFQVEITSELTFPNTPFSLPVDFSKISSRNNLKGVISQNSIQVYHAKSGKKIPVFWSDSLQTGQKGMIEWVIPEVNDKLFEIRFQLTPNQKITSREQSVPAIGTGDLLRYNSNKKRPLALCYPGRILDLNNDGQPDLIGCWNYAYKPGEPFSGIVAYPGTGDSKSLNFGDLCRLRYITDIKKKDFHNFREIYLQADFADVNADHLIDIVTCSNVDRKIHFYLNTGQDDDSGFPYFIKSLSLNRPVKDWTPLQIIDFDKDGSLDLMVNQQFLRNENRAGWPMKLEAPVSLSSGEESCLIDINGDGHADSICLSSIEGEDTRSRRVGYRLNKGTSPSQFGSFIPLNEIKVFWPTKLRSIQLGKQKGILVQHEVYQKLSFYPLNTEPAGESFFSTGIDLTSNSAVLSFSDQAWPYFCDWDDDGDLDFLVGGGYGWPRIVINEGTNKAPQYREPVNILADGKPIRLLRDDILGGKHPHNMGYPYPVFVDWDHDGLPDLLLPNETNRIFWYKNVGSLKKPQFNKRSQILCDGYPDNGKFKEKSSKLASDRSVPNSPYPYEKERPFFWRTRVAFADFTGDGLTDMVTHDGFTRKATLFKRYKDQESGELLLKKDRPLKLNDGRFIDDSIVNRRSHWTESFHPVDWDRDGLMDLIYSLAGAQNGIKDNGSIYLLRNCGTKDDPVFDPPRAFKQFGQPIRITNHGPHPWAGDIDGDTYPDLVTCVEWSVYPFYRHAVIEMKKSPTYTISQLKSN